MANKREYIITINGLTESYENVKKLKEVLDGLDDKIIRVSEEEEKTASARKSNTSSTDALSKAQQKLNEYDEAYQRELAEVNAQLSANKKEINDQIKVQQAQEVVEAKQLDTYKQKQTYLSALNTLIRNHSTATDEDKAAVAKMVQESANLQAELKETDAQMKIYVRNVGNYQGAADTVIDSHKSLRLQLRELREEMASMLAKGVSKTDEAYLSLAERAGQLSDAMGDANQDIANFASDTRGLTNAINLATSAVNAYQLYNSALQLFGDGNEEAAESMQKMMAVMTLLNSLQQVQNSLLENGSATARLYSKSVELIKSMLGLKTAATQADTAASEANTIAEQTNTASQEANALAQEANTVAEQTNTASQEANTIANQANTASTETNSGALGTNTGALGANAAASQGAAAATNTMSIAQKAGAVASKTLSVALKAIPLMAIIGLVMALIQNWESIWNWFKKTFPVLDTLSKKFNKFGGLMNAIVSGAKAVAAAVVNWLINPFKTFANVVGKILSGDFTGAWNAALEGVKNQFKGTVDAFKGEIVKGYARGQEEMSAKAATESNKRTQQELKELKIQERNNKTYSKKYIDLQKKDFEERRKMAKGNQEELDKIKIEEMQFDADVEDKKTAYAKSQANERAKNAKAAAAAAKKDADAAKKDYEKWQKELSDLIKKNQKDVEDADKTYTTARKNYLKTEDELQKKLITGVSEHYDKNLQNAILIENTIKLYEDEKKRIDALREAAKNAYDEDASEKNKKTLEYYNNQLEDTEKKLKRLRELKHITDDQFTAEQIRYQKLYSARIQIATTSFLEEQAVVREGYKQQIKDLENNLKNLNTKLSQARTEERKKEIQDEIDAAEASITILRQTIQTEFGKIGEFGTIHIPVDIDVENVNNRFTELMEAFADKGEKMPITFLELTQSMLGITQQLSDEVRPIGKIWDEALKGGKDKLMDLAETIGYVLHVSEDEMKNLEALVVKAEPFEKIEKDLMNIVTLGNTKLDDLGSVALSVMSMIQNLFKEYNETALKAYNDTITKQDKIISNNDKLIKNFQEATKGLKIEPVMEDDALSEWFEGQIVDIDKTKEHYKELQQAYELYIATVTPTEKLQESQKKINEQLEETKELYGENSEEYKHMLQISESIDMRVKREDAWQTKLEATRQKYGENSTEYKLMLNEYNSTNKAYEIEYEKSQQKLREINKKSENVMGEYFESLNKRMRDVYSALADNVFDPLAEGFGALLDYQLEELQDALEKIEEALDKATEAREESASRIEELNDEIKESDASNKENLKQQLADEQVLLVQREETERRLQKEKEKKEKEIEKKEKQQRKLELSQKLIEGLANTALGVTSALKWGFPLGPVFAAIIGAMGALQTAVIAKQLSKLEDGGIVGENGVSRSHAQGGHRIADTNIEVEGGEWVVNKRSSKKYGSLIKAINEDNPAAIQRQASMIGTSSVTYITNNYNTKQLASKQISRYANGGQLNYAVATRAIDNGIDAARLEQIISRIDFEPTVSVVDIEKKTKTLTKVRDLARG